MDIDTFEDFMWMVKNPEKYDREDLVISMEGDDDIHKYYTFQTKYMRIKNRVTFNFTLYIQDIERFFMINNALISRNYRFLQYYRLLVSKGLTDYS